MQLLWETRRKWFLVLPGVEGRKRGRKRLEGYGGGDAQISALSCLLEVSVD